MQVQGTCEKKFLKIKKLFQESFDNKEESGAAFCVIQNNKPIINLFGGIKNDNQAWDQDTIVNTFSLSKGIYAACITKLISDNLLDLEKPISYYWNTFKKNKNCILIKHLLSHQSGMYRFKEKIENKDLLDWDKIISILENQEPDHKAGEFTYYHAKTHGFLVGKLIQIITGMSAGTYLKKTICNKHNLKFFFGLENSELKNVATLIGDTKQKKIISKELEYNSFNNPENDLNFYNTKDWRKAEIPSMGGHGNAYSIAYIYYFLASDYARNTNIISNQRILKTSLTESIFRVDLSLNLPIKWTNLGFILRGGWMFGKNKEAFGHNGWGGSVGFADPINNLGIAYVTNKINNTMGADKRAVTLIKKIYEEL